MSCYQCQSIASGRLVLVICYARGAYDPAELVMKYKPSVGICGQAYARNEPVYFDQPADEDTARRQESLFGLDPVQALVTRNVGSGLSVPMYRPDDYSKSNPIGVVNFDVIGDDLEQSKFDDEVAVGLGIATAGLAGILFS